MNTENNFEAWTKKMNTLDKALGFSYYYAIFNSVFGARDVYYRVMCIDKSQFEYFGNWKKRTEI